MIDDLKIEQKEFNQFLYNTIEKFYWGLNYKIE